LIPQYSKIRLLLHGGYVLDDLARVMLIEYPLTFTQILELVLHQAFDNTDSRSDWLLPINKWFLAYPLSFFNSSCDIRVVFQPLSRNSMFDFSEQVIYTNNWMISMPFDPTNFTQQRFFHSAIFDCTYISNILRSVCSSFITGYNSLQIIIASHTRLITDSPDKTGCFVCCFLSESVCLSQPLPN